MKYLVGDVINKAGEPVDLEITGLDLAEDKNKLLYIRYPLLPGGLGVNWTAVKVALNY
ncbi:hypothetical protein D3C71_2106820 [compost metagenome]